MSGKRERSFGCEQAWWSFATVWHRGDDEVSSPSLGARTDPIRRGLRGDWTNDADLGVKNRSIAQLLAQLAFHTIGFSV
jgi:hypothetical protein